MGASIHSVEWEKFSHGQPHTLVGKFWEVLVGFVHFYARISTISEETLKLS